MKLSLLFSLVAASILLTNGMETIGRDYNRHCLCLKLESRVIPQDSLRSIEVFPRSPHCKTSEVIAGLASGERICLNPHSPWVKKLARFVVQRQSQRG